MRILLEKKRMAGRKQKYAKLFYLCSCSKILGKKHFEVFFPLHGTILTYGLTQYIVTIVSFSKPNDG